jgi:potassium efflux system protein
MRGFLDLFALVWLGLERSLRYSIATVAHYLVLLVGMLLALSRLGLRLEDLQWLLAAIGVGIGFGLQEVVSNFVSGVIILLERPLKVGDVIEISGLPGEVVDVNIRATTVRTFQNHFVLVPNKEIITQHLVNYTGRDPKVRGDISISVAYGSDTKLVRDVLLECAGRHGRVLKRPPPEVVFVAHGESSLDFELRVWTHVRDRLQMASDLRLAIDAAFRRFNISIPFPQREIHVKGPERPERDVGAASA